MRWGLFLLSLIVLPQLVAAQSPTNTADTADKSFPIPTWGQSIIDAFSRPFHPVIGGVASGGGLGAGVGYESRDNERWYREAEAMVTVRRYWLAEGEVGRRSSGKQSQLGVFGGVRHMNRIDYFGLGPNTVFEDRSAFRLRETTFGTRGWFHPVRAIRLGGSAAVYMPDLGRAAKSSVRSIEDVFTASSVPGFSAEPIFGRYRGFAELIYPLLTAPAVADAPEQYGGSYQVAVEAVRDHDSGQHSFHRWETEVQQRIPGFRPRQRLTLHGFLATTNSDADVPFYMLYTLGGSGGLKAFRPDLLGSDGTRATLRSFRNFRFRDRDLVLMQAEYRIPIVRKVYATVFVDAGQVAPRTSELFKDLRTGTGFSLSYVQKGKPIGRMDVGYGSGEGVRVSWSFGGFQN